MYNKDAFFNESITKNCSWDGNQSAQGFCSWVSQRLRARKGRGWTQQFVSIYLYIYIKHILYVCIYIYFHIFPPKENSFLSSLTPSRDLKNKTLIKNKWLMTQTDILTCSSVMCHNPLLLAAACLSIKWFSL